MANPNLADATIEYLFNEQEKIIARQLTPLQIMWFQTKYASSWKARNSLPIPAEQKDYHQYFLEIAAFDGKLSVLQEILDDHIQSNSVLKQQALVQQELKRNEDEDLAKRASQQVNNP